MKSPTRITTRGGHRPRAGFHSTWPPVCCPPPTRSVRSMSTSTGGLNFCRSLRLLDFRAGEYVLTLLPSSLHEAERGSDAALDKGARDERTSSSRMCAAPNGPAESCSQRYAASRAPSNPWDQHPVSGSGIGIRFPPSRPTSRWNRREGRGCLWILAHP